MGASIYWQPVEGKHLHVGARSRFITMMSEAFGSYPWELQEHDLTSLQGMHIGTEDEGIKEALSVLIDAVRTHSSIRVWPEY